MIKAKRLVSILLIALIAILSAGCGGMMRPYINSQPVSFDGNCGDTATFRVYAGGPGPLYYQWRWNGINLYNGDDGGRVWGANSDTLVITDLLSGHTGSISVVVWNSAGSVVSNTVSLYVRDTLDYQISWPSGDIDIGVEEPDGQTFYAGDVWESHNGYFSDDYNNGGTEWWVMDRVHEIGSYRLKIWDWLDTGYTGYISITVHHNENLVPEQTTMSYPVQKGVVYTLTPIYVERSTGRGELKFEVTSEPIPPGAAKPGPKGPSPRPFGG